MNNTNSSDNYTNDDTGTAITFILIPFFLLFMIAKCLCGKEEKDDLQPVIKNKIIITKLIHVRDDNNMA